jgi:hypothetical protein
MPDKSGHVYGLTILAPIVEDDHLEISHAIELRDYLATLPKDETSPFAQVPGTHLARLVVMDDVVYVGAPACEEHLKNRYLVFEANFDGDLDPYLQQLALKVPDFVQSVWQHCVGYPGTKDVNAFVEYMKKCRIETTFFFADVNDRTLGQTLKALQVQTALAHFIERHQGLAAAELQQAFGDFLRKIAAAPIPLPAAEYKHVHTGKTHAAGTYA